MKISGFELANRRYRKNLLGFFICFFFVFVSGEGFCIEDKIPYSVPSQSWDEKYGNHRAVLKVDNASDIAGIDFLWRRHDTSPEKRRMMIVNAENGKEIANIYRIHIDNERCELVFGPVEKGTYYFYYLPYEVQEGYGFYGQGYLTPEDKVDSAWVARHELDKPKEQWVDVTSAQVQEIQSRTEFDSFWPMEVIATEQEKEAYFSEKAYAYLLFPEDRQYPIRMKDNIPMRWLGKKQNEAFEGTAMRNEYYCYQLGLYAHKQKIEDVNVKFSDLKNKAGQVIRASTMTCFNTGGVDAYGEAFTKKIDVNQRQVQALWIGIDVAPETKPGDYKGKVTVCTKNQPDRSIDVLLHVSDEIIEERGDNETWRHSRLRWLNSTVGIDDNPVAPYTPLDIRGRKIGCLGRNVKLSDSGLPEKIDSWGDDLLSEPIRCFIRQDGKSSEVSCREFRFTAKKTGRADWQSHGNVGSLKVDCQGSMEYDGYLNIQIKLHAKSDVEIEDFALEIPFKKEIAEYMMGMGLGGTEVPESHQSKWSGPHDSFWVGNTKGGLHCELRGASYTGPMLNLFRPKPPASWHNGGKGGFAINKSGNTVTARVFSGQRVFRKNEEITFEFALIITPVKPLDTASQFIQRYYHNGSAPTPTMDDLKAGVKIINVHHANQYNPNINYPFVALDKMQGFIDKWHKEGMRVKIYYTVRELTNYVMEMWALRSLGTEVLAGGRGGGYPWLREHLIDDYTPQWYQHLGDQSPDAAIKTSGTSRWYNYYVEGLGWLVRNMDIDGIYLDDVSYDRRILKRMRHVMNANKPGCIIDLHSNTGFSKGPATQYTEFFPYIDKLWFGESFRYDSMPPANWLVEVSGIPFGLMGDMLHEGGNRWRGMIYGMTVRHPWVTNGVLCDPRPIWKVWDEFGIHESEMIGYWEDNCPVTCDRSDVLVTTYVKEDKVLIALASWAKEDQQIKLIIDWDQLGMSPKTSILSMPAIKDYQAGGDLTFDQPIHVKPTQGKLLILNSEPPTHP